MCIRDSYSGGIIGEVVKVDPSQLWRIVTATFVHIGLEPVSYTHLDVYKRQEFAHLIKKLGNPQRLVWGEMPDGGMGYRATYQVAGQPEVVMEFKKKGKKLVLI